MFNPVVLAALVGRRSGAEGGRMEGTHHGASCHREDMAEQRGGNQAAGEGDGPVRPEAEPVAVPTDLSTAGQWQAASWRRTLSPAGPERLSPARIGCGVDELRPGPWGSEAKVTGFPTESSRSTLDRAGRFDEPSAIGART